MKMEVNKDEAFRCIKIAEKYIEVGNTEKAYKFLIKAEKLYPSTKASKLLESLKCNANTKKESSELPSKKAAAADKENIRQEGRMGSTTAKDYTEEQLKQVQRIKKCKNYYEILNVSKEATDSEVKKAYKKLALQLHPDKNKAPGAAEAFKAIGNAVSILTDMEKRKQYDLYGSNNTTKFPYQKHHTQYQEYTRGFEADMTAEELFNMFFGSGFSTHHSNVFTRRNGRWHHTNDEADNSTQSQHNGAALFIQLLPILLLIVLSMLSSLFISDPVFSLQPNAKYPITRHTTRLNVPYYVKDNFRLDYQGSLARLEANIEEEYINALRHNCYKEKNNRDAMMWKAQTIGDESLFTKAKNIRTPSCDEFLKIAKMY